jgi:hypothetical protein
MKIRTLKLSPEQLIRAIQGKPITLNLPSDLELLDIKYNVFTKQVTAVIRSDSFEDVAESRPIPELIMSPPIQKAPTQPAVNASLGVGVKTLEAKQAPKTMTKPQLDQDTGGLEGEFTKEQRKLLRFAVDGEYVIVKPTQFLKTEWEDINDTVKSLGGQWVKGDIINYWLIPRHQS